MNKQTIRRAWETIRRPLAFFCSGMIVMILAVFNAIRALFVKKV